MYELYEFVLYNLYMYEFILYNLYKKRTNYMNPYVWICTRISEKKKKTRLGFQPGTNMACNRRSVTPSTTPPSPLVPILFTVVCPHTSTYSFSVSPCTYYFNHFSYTPTTKPLSRFFGNLFVYLNLVSVYFTHRNITFCLPPFVIIHFYVTRV